MPFILINLCYIILFGLSTIMLRYFSLHISVLNNNTVRFLSGGLVLLVIVGYFYREQLKLLRSQTKLLGWLILLAVMMSTNMYFYVEGIRYTSAVTAAIFSVLSMPFAIIIAAFFFEDEKQRIKNRQFQLGSALTLTGALLFILLGQSQITATNNFLLGGGFLFLAILIQSTQNLIIKRINNRINAITLGCMTSLLAGGISLFLSYATHQLPQLSTQSTEFTLFLIIGGIFGVLVGMTFSFYIVQSQGITTYQILQLTTPISVAFIGFFTLSEPITLWQIAAALLVMIGAIFALQLFAKKQ